MDKPRILEKLGAMGRRVVASYCSSFLKPEMLHIYEAAVAAEHHRPLIDAAVYRSDHRAVVLRAADEVFAIRENCAVFLMRFRSSLRVPNRWLTD